MPSENEIDWYVISTLTKPKEVKDAKCAVLNMYFISKFMHL
jgi:hypothetical protein